MFSRVLVRIAITLLLPTALGFWPRPVSGNTASATASDAPLIKAAIIYNIFKFVDWPAPTEVIANTLVINVVGTSNDAPAFDSIDGMLVGSTPIDVEESGIDVDLAKSNCSVLYVGEFEPSVIAELLASVNGRPVLTISAMDGFCERGGVLQLFERDHRLAFRINLVAAEQAGLKLSSQLLKVADVVAPLGD